MDAFQGKLMHLKMCAAVVQERCVIISGSHTHTFSLQIWSGDILQYFTSTVLMTVEALYPYRLWHLRITENMGFFMSGQRANLQSSWVFCLSCMFLGFLPSKRNNSFRLSPVYILFPEPWCREKLDQGCAAQVKHGPNWGLTGMCNVRAASIPPTDTRWWPLPQDREMGAGHGPTPGVDLSCQNPCVVLSAGTKLFLFSLPPVSLMSLLIMPSGILWIVSNRNIQCILLFWLPLPTHTWF